MCGMAPFATSSYWTGQPQCVKQVQLIGQLRSCLRHKCRRVEQSVPLLFMTERLPAARVPHPSPPRDPANQPAACLPTHFEDEEASDSEVSDPKADRVDHLDPKPS